MQTETEPVIRQRQQVRSMRRRDGLIRYARDDTSQNGEDGIIERIFQVLPNNESRWCVDVGAWDGVHLSNTHSLLLGPNKWRGVLVEADPVRFDKLEQLHAPLHNICLCHAVSGEENHPHTLTNILRPLLSNPLPANFDFLCIDIDGSDYWVLHDLLKEGTFSPKVICIEFNPTMPDDLVFVPIRSDAVRQGASLSALVELANQHDYVLVETTLYNAFFLQKSLYHEYFLQEVPDTSIEALHESTMGTQLYQLYNGTVKLWGCKKLLWHRLPLDESKMQVLSLEDRRFPFAPEQPVPFDTASVVDLSSYCQEDCSNHQARQHCSSQLLKQLQKDGFCLVCGLDMSQNLCEQALYATDSLLQQAAENVRRSCLTQDRARRGYSPMNSENFASLIGQHGPNDLVRKFRVGPLPTLAQNSKSCLFQPNVWPTADAWDVSHATSFRTAVEDYYKAACTAGQILVKAICEGLLAEYPELEKSLGSLTTNQLSHSSILTLLGYRVGTRHKGKNKGPLVAAHTDVGVITMLLFDSGNCASLQRSDGKGGWVNVSLPDSVPANPIFVVNVGDLLSDLSRGQLPSTLHRVVARQGSTPRNCCALFVGLDPKVELEIDGTSMTYEEWRKRRIARAQNVLKASSESQS